MRLVTPPVLPLHQRLRLQPRFCSAHHIRRRHHSWGSNQTTTLNWMNQKRRRWSSISGSKKNARRSRKKVTYRSASDQWFADRNRPQLQVSGYSHLLRAGLGDEHQLHPEEDSVDNILPPAAEEAWPTAWDPDTVLQGCHRKRAVLLASSLVAATHRTRRHVWTVSSGTPGELSGASCLNSLEETFTKRSVARFRRTIADRFYAARERL